MDIYEMIQRAISGNKILDDEMIKEDWMQVGKLTLEDEGRRRGMKAKDLEYERELKMLEMKITSLRAQLAADIDEWWFHLHKEYGLADGNYHVMNDGRILCEPKEKNNGDLN